MKKSHLKPIKSRKSASISLIDKRYLSRISNEIISIKSRIMDLKRKLTDKADIKRLTILRKRVAKIEHRLITLVI